MPSHGNHKKNVDLRNSTKPVYAVSAVSLALVLLHAIFTFLLPAITPGPFFKRTWGFDAIRYFPLPCIAGFYAIALLVCLPQVNRVLWTVIYRLYAAWRRRVPSLNRHIAIALFCLAGGAVFFALHARYGLLGDNYVRVVNISRGDFLKDEFGTIYLLHYFYLFLHSRFSISAYTALQIFTYLAGAVLLFLVVKIAEAAGTSRFEKIVIIAFFPLFGATQHFCGYIEDYASAVVLIVAYFYAAQLALKGRLSPWLAGFTLLVAMADHLIACMLAPSFIYVIYECRLKNIRFFRDYRVWVGATLVAIAAALILFKGLILPRLYPLVPQADGRMTMFSLVRIREYFNGEMLGSGIGFFLGLACLAVAVRARRRLTPFLYFLLIASVSTAGFLFAFDETLGAGDWDVYSFSSIPINLFAILMLLFLVKRSRFAEPGRFVAGIAIIFMGLHTAPWVIVNATDLSIQRVKDVLLTDPGTYFITHPADMHLGCVFEANKLQEESDSIVTKAFERNANDPRNTFNYIQVLTKNNDINRALRLNDTLASKSPAYYLGLKNLFVLAAKSGNDTLAFSALVRIFNGYLNYPKTITRYCNAYELSNDFSMLVGRLLQQNRLPEADTVCKFMCTFCPDDDYGRYLHACILIQSGRFDDGLAICYALIGKNPRMQPLYTLAAQALGALGDRSSAIKLLKTGIASVSNEQGQIALRAQLHDMGG